MLKHIFTIVLIIFYDFTLTYYKYLELQLLLEKDMAQSPRILDVKINVITFLMYVCTA